MAKTQIYILAWTPEKNSNYSQCLWVTLELWFFFTLFTRQCLVQMGTSQLLYSRILHLTKFLLILGTYGHICIFCRAAGLSGVSVTSNIPHGLTEKPELVIEQPGTSRIPAPKLIFKNAHCLPLEVAKIASYYSEYCQREGSKHLSCPSCPNHISREPNG